MVVEFSTKSRFKQILGTLQNTSLSKIYLILALPAMIALSVIISPFGSNDEQQHFLRIVAIIEGHFIPEVSYDRYSDRLDKRVAGGRVGSQVIAVAKEVDYGRSGVDPKFKISLDKIKVALRRYDDRGQSFSEHSNTALYPPVLYVAPILAVGVAKLLHAPILSWLYLGRFANSLASCALCWFAIRRGAGISHVLLILACLPIFLFQGAALSADALLLPLFLVFASIISRLACASDITSLDKTVLAVTTFVISVGKIAYLPVAILPAFIVWSRSRKTSSDLRYFLLVFLVSLIGWAAWAYIVHDKVFSILPNVVVDPKRQLLFMVDQPMAAVHTFTLTIVKFLPSGIIDSIGRKLGYETIRIPITLSIILSLSVVSASLIRPEGIRPKSAVIHVVLLICCICFFVTLTLLYLQSNAVGAIYIWGMQGRYLSPLLILICVFLPTIKRVQTCSTYLHLFSMSIATVSAFSTISIAYLRY